MDKLQARPWPLLLKSDDELREEISSILSNRVEGSPYSPDGEYAKSLDGLPVGLRAMAATHWLDISLTLDSITWHFGNFGEPRLVAHTESGLTELGLIELTECFRDAKDLILPILPQKNEEEDWEDFIERKGIAQAVEKIDDKGWDLRDTEGGKSSIYEAWIRYARQHPENVF